MKHDLLPLIRKAHLVTKSTVYLPLRRGFSLVEVILSSAIFVLLVTAFVGGFLYGEEATALSGNHVRAHMYAEEGLEAVRNIRDSGFSNLTDGTFGLSSAGNQWSLSGTQDTQNLFTRQVTITNVAADRKTVTSTVTWQQNPQRTGSVTTTTYLTNWIAQVGGGGGSGGSPPASCAAYCQALPTGYSSGTCRQNNQKCSQNGEIYESGGDSICSQNFPGDASHDTCCCLP